MGKSCFGGLLALVLATSCGGSDTSPAPPAGPDQNCQAPDIYRPGIDKVGATSGVRVAIVDAIPAPPAEEANEWLLHITDANGAPISNARVTVIPTMDHGDNKHGVPRSVLVTELATPGEYQIEDLWLNMPGLWKVIIEVLSEDGRSVVDSVVFSFCAADR